MSRRRKSDNNSYWEAVKKAFGPEPSEVNAQWTIATEYFRQEIITLIKGRFDIKCPEWWDKDFMLDLLILEGRFFVADSAIGIAPFNGSAHGLNVFLRPSRVTITNEIIGTFTRKLFFKPGENKIYGNTVAVYLYDSHYYRSMSMLINKYAEKLANIDASIDVNLMNTRVAYIFNATNQQQADEAKLVYEQITQGKPAVFTKVKDKMSNDDSGLDVSSLPVKDLYIVDKLLEARTAIIGELLTKLGLNNTAYEKKERLIVDEVNSNNAEIEANVAYIKENLKECSEKVRSTFGIDFEIKLKEYDIYGKKNEQNLHKETDS